MWKYTKEEKFPVQFFYQGKPKTETNIDLTAGGNVKENLGKVAAKDDAQAEVSSNKELAVSEGKANEVIPFPDVIPGGSFLIARKIFKSEIWLKHPFYLKVWLWILGQASHADHKKDNRTYKRGELITTYDEIIKGVAYHYRHRLVFPTIQQIRDILKWLESEEMIEVQPLCQKRHKNFVDTTGLGTDPKAGERTDLKPREKTYLGIKIIVINYDTYQTLDNYKRTEGKSGEKTDPKAGERTEGFSEKQHDNKNGTTKEDNIYGQNFLTFWKAYPNKAAKKKAHEAWQKLEKKKNMKALLPTLLDAIEKQKQVKETKRAKGAFVEEWPHGATWLNGKRWEDEINPEEIQPEQEQDVWSHIPNR